jgi:glutaredoxin 2
MKILWQFIAPTAKAIASVIAVLIGIGWGAFASIQLIVKAESASIRTEFDSKRAIDIKHIDKRFDDTHAILKEIKQDIRNLK